MLFFSVIPGLEEYEPGVVPIYPTVDSMTIPYFTNNQPSLTKVKRDQLPLYGAYAFTSYKAQGKTFERAIMDVPDEHELYTGDHATAYVLFSRVRSLQGILLTKPLRAAQVNTCFDSELESSMGVLSQFEI